jgi:hypothetical protein
VAAAGACAAGLGAAAGGGSRGEVPGALQALHEHTGTPHQALGSTDSSGQQQACSRCCERANIKGVQSSSQPSLLGRLYQTGMTSGQKGCCMRNQTASVPLLLPERQPTFISLTV